MNLFHIQSLIAAVKEKSKAKGFGFADFEYMAEELERVTGEPFRTKYLKYNLYEGGSKNPREGLLDVIAGYLDFKNFRTFVDSIKMEVDPILQSMEGEYYCYVRMNLEKGKILRSPVRISLKEGQVHYHLKGGRLTYTGEITKREGCLFVLMRSEEGKSFYHVYRIGARRSPEVLQGIFSGVSTDFEPIGGRAILWRSNENFDSMKTSKLDISSMQKSKQKKDKLLAAYFERKDSNNLSIKSVYTFGPEDLE